MTKPGHPDRRLSDEGGSESPVLSHKGRECATQARNGESLSAPRVARSVVTAGAPNTWPPPPL